jgi:hypothetical protein
VRELDVPKFQPMSVPIYDDIFQREECVSDLSRFMGIPLAVRKIPVDDYWELDRTNYEAASMFRICNLGATETIAGANPDTAVGASYSGARPSSSHSNASMSGLGGSGLGGSGLGGSGLGGSSVRGGSSSRGGRGGSFSGRRDLRLPEYPLFNGFGGIPQDWEPTSVGAVLVVRLDRKPLHPLHGEAIAAYFTSVLNRSFAEVVDAEQRRAWSHTLRMAGTGVTNPQVAAAAWVSERDVFDRRRNVLAIASQMRFEDFFGDYKEKRIRGRPDLLDEDVRDDASRIERWSVRIEEVEPKPEWEDVPSPYSV